MLIIFQDPYSSLNPRMSVSEAIMEPMIIQGKMKKQEMITETKSLMDIVGIAERFENSYPHDAADFGGIVGRSLCIVL
jgi:peptide/nickel transport system ATP-binding protein